MTDIRDDIKHSKFYSLNSLRKAIKSISSHTSLLINFKMSGIPFPIVSFQPFLDGLDEEQARVAQELYDAFHTIGWIYLKDFGISQQEIEEMFSAVSDFKTHLLQNHNTDEA